MPSVIGIDIGGTKVAGVRYDATSWASLEEKRIPTKAERGFSAVIEDVCAMIKDLRRDDTIAVGVGVPGPVKQPEGVLLVAPNIPGSENTPLQTILNDKIGLPVVVTNDNQGFAYAEAMQGAGKGKRVVCAVALGTGVGGGVVIDGKIFAGANGSAGEFGHMLLRPGNPPFETDDKRGDVEQFLSGKSWKKRCAEAKKPEDILEGDTCSYLHPLIYQEVSWLCANVIYSYDPDVIVIGGSAGKALKTHEKQILEELPKWLLKATKLPQISISEMHGAGMLGAALLAKEAA